MYVCTPIPSPNHHKEVSQCSQCTGTVKQTNQTHGQQCAVRCHTVGQKSKFCPKCSSNPIMVTFICICEFASKAATNYAYDGLQPYNKRSRKKIANGAENGCLKVEQAILNRGSLQIPLTLTPIGKWSKILLLLQSIQDFVCKGLTECFCDSIQIPLSAL